jgi:hypothetical protein
MPVIDERKLHRGVAVVPRHELYCGMTTGTVLAEAPKPVVVAGTDCAKHRVVAVRELTARYVLPVVSRRRRSGIRPCPRTLVTDLIFGWSGATPARTRPNGVVRASSRSTSNPEVSKLVCCVEAGRACSHNDGSL